VIVDHTLGKLPHLRALRPLQGEIAEGHFGLAAMGAVAQELQVGFLHLGSRRRAEPHRE
jgi:hypothetical protein